VLRFRGHVYRVLGISDASTKDKGEQRPRMDVHFNLPAADAAAHAADNDLLNAERRPSGIDCYAESRRCYELDQGLIVCSRRLRAGLQRVDRANSHEKDIFMTSKLHFALSPEDVRAKMIRKLRWIGLQVEASVLHEAFSQLRADHSSEPLSTGTEDSFAEAFSG
jgi:hypothetical protein